MKKNNIVLILLLSLSVFIFKENTIIKKAMIDSTNIWFKQIFVTLLPTYFIIDLLINYGITKYIKSNKLFLILVSLFLGAPSNAKYILEFLDEGLISKNQARHLLFSVYSPSLLFLLSLNYFSNKLVLYLYIISFILYVCSSIFFKSKENKHTKKFKTLSFTECLEKSIKNSLNIVILILGIICFYKIILVFLESLNLNFLGLLLELTNTTHIIIKNDLGFKFLLFICLFGGISVHTQVKSIIPLEYKYFLYGRVFSLLLFFLICFFSIIK